MFNSGYILLFHHPPWFKIKPPQFEMKPPPLEMKPPGSKSTPPGTKWKCIFSFIFQLYNFRTPPKKRKKKEEKRKNIVRFSPEKSDVCLFFNQNCENKLENCRKFWNQILWKLFIHHYSFVSFASPRRSGPPRAPPGPSRPSGSWPRPAPRPPPPRLGEN